MKKFLTMAIAFVTLSFYADNSVNFNSVAKHLKTGGEFYLYLSAEQGIASIKNQVSSIKTIILNNQGTPAADKEQIKLVMGFLSKIIGQSGISQINSIGMSSIKDKNELYDNRIFIYHEPGQGTGKLWSVFGTEPHSLECLKFLPSNTVATGFTDFNANETWNWIASDINNSNRPTLKQEFNTSINNCKAYGIDLDKIMSSLDGKIGFILTMNEANKIQLPLGEGNVLSIPSLSFMLVLKVKDDTIYNLIKSKTALNTNPAQNLAYETASKDSKTLKFNISVPYMPGTIEIVQKDGYLFLASSENIVKEALAVYAGSQKGLTDTQDFKNFAGDIPLSGNSFKYLSPKLSKSIVDIFIKLNPEQEFLFKGYENFGSFSVSSVLNDGILIRNSSSVNMGSLMVSQLTVMPVLLTSAMLLPALNKARSRAKVISNANKLKMIGIACMEYSINHNNTFPDKISDLEGIADKDKLTDENGQLFKFYQKDMKKKFSPDTILIMDKSLPGYTNILYADGHVKTISE